MKKKKRRKNLKKGCFENMTKLENSSKSLNNRIQISMNQILSEKKMKAKLVLICFTQKDRKIEELNS